MWFNRIEQDEFSCLPDCIAYFESELVHARKELDVRGRRLEDVAKTVPGLVEFRFAQLQEIEAILRHMEIKLERVRGLAHRRYMEQYDRALTSRDAEKYAATDDDVLSMAAIVNQVAYLRNRYLAVQKGLEGLHYQLSNITKLRAAGLEDATL